MANRNGLGPNNEGAMTGRGIGNCTTDSKSTDKVSQAVDIGMALGRGLGRGMAQGGRGRGRRGFFGRGRRNDNSNS